MALAGILCALLICHLEMDAPIIFIPLLMVGVVICVAEGVRVWAAPQDQPVKLHQEPSAAKDETPPASAATLPQREDTLPGVLADLKHHHDQTRVLLARADALVERAQSAETTARRK